MTAATSYPATDATIRATAIWSLHRMGLGEDGSGGAGPNPATGWQWGNDDPIDWGDDTQILHEDA